MRQYYDGDMNLYGYGIDEESSTLPEKTKQIGALESQMRIYIEDYVYTYLYQYGKSNGGKEKVAALVGRHLEMNGEDSVVICGAIQGKGASQKNGVESFSEETWEYIGSQMETYFKGMTLVGWVHLQPGFGSFLMAKDELFHEEFFKEKWQILFVIDSLDKMDTFYIYNEEKKSLRQARGYFVYYDKNKEMQEYMLDNSMVHPKEEEQVSVSEEELLKMQGGETLERKRRRPKPEERMDAAKEIRRVLQKRAKEAEEAQRGRYTMLVGVSSVLCVVCLCMGFALMSNMTRLRSLEGEIVSVQSSYAKLEESIEGVKVQAAFAAETTEPKQEENKEQPKQVEEEAVKTWYTVEAGDSLGFISSKYYGDNSGIAKIMNANDLENADMIYAGQSLLIP
ncbi:LysM peptidoglycan-binding domain-containing protein [Anaerotignum sp.]|uniref:LysM peptidoglycan-binding domain-containing protein n=1 Tax=Anaerotignum sp. TaxID=2039241 RepID=UPI0027150726|nr:LysM peptidoglycan-binding domain-containing protein [Anaerotignum sp.]